MFLFLLHMPLGRLTAQFFKLVGYISDLSYWSVSLFWIAEQAFLYLLSSSCLRLQLIGFSGRKLFGGVCWGICSNMNDVFKIQKRLCLTLMGFTQGFNTTLLPSGVHITSFRKQGVLPWDQHRFLNFAWQFEKCTLKCNNKDRVFTNLIVIPQVCLF